jgi:hypothetical protein
MMRVKISYLWLSSIIFLFMVVFAQADRLRQREELSAPGWVMRGAALDLNFASGMGWQQGIGIRPVAQLITATRNGGSAPETTLLPSSPSGASYQSFANGTPAIIPGVGLLNYEPRTNYLLNSTAPATQTTASLAAGVYTGWMNGAGSVAFSAGTAVGTGFGAATQGNQVQITITTAGTVVATVSGSVNAFQLESGASSSSGTPLIVTGGSTATRGADVATVNRPPTFAQALTLLVSSVPLTNAGNTTQTPVQIDDGTNNNRIDVDRGSSSGLIGGGITVNPTAYTAPNTIVWNTGVPVATAYALAVNDQALVSNGTLGTYTGGNAMFTPARIVIGANGNGVHQLNGIITRLAVWPTARQSNSFLLAITP